MIERDKEYYNQKINELYNIIESRDKNINDLEKENRELKADLEMYENGVYFSSENDKLQTRIDKAIEYIENNTYSSVSTMKKTLYLQNDELYALIEILKGGNNE